MANKILVIAVILVIVISAFGIFLINSFIPTGKAIQTNQGSDSASIPQECKLPDGQDLTAWKEHLGHHENTKYCLNYYK